MEPVSDWLVQKGSAQLATTIPREKARRDLWSCFLFFLSFFSFFRPLRLSHFFKHFYSWFRSARLHFAPSSSRHIFVLPFSRVVSFLFLLLFRVFVTWWGRASLFLRVSFFFLFFFFELVTFQWVFRCFAGLPTRVVGMLYCPLPVTGNRALSGASSWERESSCSERSWSSVNDEAGNTFSSEAYESALWHWHEVSPYPVYVVRYSAGTFFSSEHVFSLAVRRVASVDCSDWILQVHCREVETPDLFLERCHCCWEITPQVVLTAIGWW